MVTCVCSCPGITILTLHRITELLSGRALPGIPCSYLILWGETQRMEVAACSPTLAGDRNCTWRDACFQLLTEEECAHYPVHVYLGCVQSRASRHSPEIEGAEPEDLCSVPSHAGTLALESGSDVILDETLPGRVCIWIHINHFCPEDDCGDFLSDHRFFDILWLKSFPVVLPPKSEQA